MSVVRAWVVAAALAACASNRAPPRARVVEPVADEADPEAEPVAGDPPSPLDAGCARVPRGAVCLPEGLSGLGADTGEARFEERPPHAVRLGAFAIDRREVSGRAYLRCVANGRCGPPGCEVAASRHVSARLRVRHSATRKVTRSRSPGGSAARASAMSRSPYFMLKCLITMWELAKASEPSWKRATSSSRCVCP